VAEGEKTVDEGERQLRLAFVGCGNIAKYHLSAALKTGRVAVTALIDPSEVGRDAIMARFVDN
jgi:predicted dehydrogenase